MLGRNQDRKLRSLFNYDYKIALINHLSVRDGSAASNVLISGTVGQNMTMLELKSVFKINC